MTNNDILNHPLIAARYFFPRRESPTTPFWVDVDGARLACHLHRTPNACGTLIYFHGNGEVVADYLAGFPELMARLGWNCLLAEFRGYGASTGSPNLGQLLDDVKPIIQSVDDPPQKIVLFGRSVGSIFAIEGVELFGDIAGLILESGIADVEERLRLRVIPEELGATSKELSDACTERLDHQKKLSGYKGPALVLHTTHDELVDVSHGQRLHDWLGGDKSLRIFVQGGHNDISFVNADAYWQEVATFLARIAPS
jgi:pimeloyl-ACP methyl ester carboxylesterase